VFVSAAKIRIFAQKSFIHPMIFAKYALFLKIFDKKFGNIVKNLYLCTRLNDRT